MIIRKKKKPYQINIIISQMEQWPTLRNIVNYLKYDRNLRDFYNFDIKALEQKMSRKIYDKLKEEDRQVIDLDFGNTADKSKGEYLDIYDGARSEVLCTKKIDENSDLNHCNFNFIVISIAIIAFITKICP